MNTVNKKSQNKAQHRGAKPPVPSPLAVPRATSAEAETGWRLNYSALVDEIYRAVNDNSTLGFVDITRGATERVILELAARGYVVTAPADSHPTYAEARARVRARVRALLTEKTLPPAPANQPVRLTEPLTGKTANALITTWPWSTCYWTARRADVRAILAAARKFGAQDKFVYHESKEPSTGKYGWLLLRIA